MSRSSLFAFSLFFSASVAGCETASPPPVETKPAPAASPTPAPTPTPAPPPPAASAAPAPKPAPEATPPKEAERTKSGLAMLVLTPGTGKNHPKKGDSVRLTFTGWVGGKQVFASSEPTLMPFDQLAPGWQEALTKMVEGEKRRLWLPSKIAFGNAMGPAPSEDLIMDLEFIGSVAPLPAPKDLKQPPSDAKKTASGLVYKLLTKGSGTTHPTPASNVTVHYSGWSKDGKMFDSSVTRGSPTSFGLGQVIPGWTEGVQLMVVGDKMRFWIPAKLAYGETPKRPGAPAGDLVFDVELLAMR
jgi:FKBP-type peptidyl-prolyl cis-trans isomerase